MVDGLGLSKSQYLSPIVLATSDAMMLTGTRGKERNRPARVAKSLWRGENISCRASGGFLHSALGISAQCQIE